MAEPYLVGAANWETQARDAPSWLADCPRVLRFQSKAFVDPSQSPGRSRGIMMTKTQQYCLDCEKLLDSSITAEREFMDASVFRPLTDASGHVHYTQKGICDKCGESKVVSCYELLPG